ncbi:hypothetical protein [Candidatus Mycobacterium methanotrophicum]|uniref:Integral membrane protein n=1 Tax=Candidatus Mycobacterium methanotrophicum TaxID=2943498 RepID=A0ABY4QKY8_9MYCO|nr:hypothetical protein [Candidatus Mycobacterium methanotrophicum]UQX10458.1 hypothetical protein M5I08_20615 [Candidatus Mycobacterium methanotrophicum]
MTAVTGLAPRPLADSTDSLLRFAMRLDAAVTGLAGLMIAAAADPLSSLTGLSSIAEYGIGAFFVLYGLVVFALAAAPHLRRAGIGVAVTNVVFTVAAVAVVACNTSECAACRRDSHRAGAGRRCQRLRCVPPHRFVPCRTSRCSE